MERTKPTNGQISDDMLQVLSALASRQAMASKLGFSHGGERDVWNTLGYPNKITSKNLIERWRRQDIARAVVDKPVKATWRGDVGVLESTEEDHTPLEKEYVRLDRELKLKQVFARVDRLAHLGKYAIILLGFDDSSQDTWSQSVEPGQRELKYVRVISEDNCDISTYELDTSNARYGRPRIYNVKLKHPGQQEKSTSLKVHYSRVIHVTLDLLEDEIEGVPFLETVYNRLVDLEKLVGGSAEMFWRGARPGYAGKADPDYKVDSDVEDKLMEQLKEYENDLRRFLVTEGVDIESLAQQIADPKSHVDIQLMMVSAVTGIPMRILVGSERGELASSQDDSNWKEWVYDRQKEIAEPNIIRPFIKRMVETGVLPEPEDEMEGYQISWPDLFTLSEKDKAEVGAKRAKAFSDYMSNPMGEQIIPPEAFMRYVLRMDDDEVNHILEMQESELKDIVERENELQDDLDAPAENEQETES